MVSIIIPYHNEGRSFIQECVQGIRSTIDIDNYEIIVVDDGSEIPLKPLSGAKVIRSNQNKGVGAAFDWGVKEARGDILFIMGSDIRFIKNKWASQLKAEVEKHKWSLICTTCVMLDKDNMDINKRKDTHYCNGATILMYQEKYKTILEAKWLPRLKDKDVDSYDIPCALGAFYGITKDWYNHLGGFWGHRHWGTLEPYISLKSWMFGGGCRVAPRIETGHIFKKKGTHGTPQSSLFFNKMLVATLLFDDYSKLISRIGRNRSVDSGELIYKKMLPEIKKKKQEIREKTVLTAEEFMNKFKL